MSNSPELASFRAKLLLDVVNEIHNNEEGGMKEEIFTELAINFLVEAQETENARECREIREDSIGRRLHKINGYALSENYETLDLFITIFRGTDEIPRIPTDEFKASLSQATRFLKNALNKYLDEIEETAPIFDFAKTIGAIEKELVRVNVYVLSDGTIATDTPADSALRDILIKYHIRDIEYLFKISSAKNNRIPIEIDFTRDYGGAIRCLSHPEVSDYHHTYLAIVHGTVLAAIYKDHGARVLEQNVRSFLQFRGKINKGIRDTIIDKPHMFIAFNNGVTATAESVNLQSDGMAIEKVKDFQIVNGGQTTASILHTFLKNKTVAKDQVFVQMKLTVISDVSRKTEIVSHIAKYANTQNKVSEADLTSNNPFHIELEKLSRVIWAPPGIRKTLTQWFYERARGQYNDELSKHNTPFRKKMWLSRSPKSQMFDKEDMARYWMSWNKTPWWVVKGRQRNFIELMKLSDSLIVDNVFFEDLVAKAIIFKTAESLYGTGAKAIGDLRYIVVPYTVSWLSFRSNVNLDLFKIWKNQSLSSSLSRLIEKCLRDIDSFMRKSAPGGLIGEWGKKEDCWKKLIEQYTEFDTSSILDDLTTEEMNQRRYHWNNEDKENEVRKSQESELIEISKQSWKKIQEWARVTGRISAHQQDIIWNIEKKVSARKTLSDIEIRNGLEILELIINEAPELIDAPEDQPDNHESKSELKITSQIVNQMFQWERKHKRLFTKEVLFLKKIVNSRQEPTEFQNQYLNVIYKKLIKQGFKNND